MGPGAFSTQGCLGRHPSVRQPGAGIGDVGASLVVLLPGGGDRKIGIAGSVPRLNRVCQHRNELGMEAIVGLSMGKQIAERRTLAPGVVPEASRPRQGFMELVAPAVQLGDGGLRHELRCITRTDLADSP